MIPADFLRMLLEHYLGKMSRKAIDDRMTAAIPKIMQGMISKGMTLSQNSPRTVIRDALFRLWRAVIPSGTIADLVRDSQDDKVVARVTSKLTPASDLAELIVLTKKEALDLFF